MDSDLGGRIISASVDFSYDTTTGKNQTERISGFSGLRASIYMTKLSTTDILTIKITQSNKDNIKNYLTEYLSQEADKPLVIFTPNPELVVLADKIARFNQFLNSADIALPDGYGMVWAGKLRRPKVVLKRIAGVEFMQELVKLAAEKDYSIGLIGGRGGVAKQVLDKLQLRDPKLKGWAEDGPEIEIQNDKCEIKFIDKKKYFRQLTQRIIQADTRIVFVGLGAYKQEYLITNLKSQILNLKYNQPVILMAVGGAFDIVSGKLLRAPKIWQELKLEWLWRLVQEPRRISRQLNLIKFTLMVLNRRFCDKISLSII